MCVVTGGRSGGVVIVGGGVRDVSGGVVAREGGDEGES